MRTLLRRSLVLLVLGTLAHNSFATSPFDAKLCSVLERGQVDPHKNLPDSVLLHYGIFQGRSALRDIDMTNLSLVNMPSTVLAIVLLLMGEADAAHEVLLGVLPDNLDEAEYAATHRGQTDWADQHPLSDAADLIHSVIHRLEGSSVGEGGHIGYENAKYWLAGGPKQWDGVPHVLSHQLLKHVQNRAPQLYNVLCPSVPRQHSILAGGGKRRTVTVPVNSWDGFAFIDLCKECREGSLSHETLNEIRELECFELMELLRMELD